MSKLVEIFELQKFFQGKGSEISKKTTPVQLEATLVDITDALDAVEEVSSGAGQSVKKCAEKAKIAIFKSFVSKDILGLLDGYYFDNKTVAEMTANLKSIIGEKDEKKEKKMANQKFLKMSRLTSGMAQPESFSSFLERLIVTVAIFCTDATYSCDLVAERFSENLDKGHKLFLLHSDWDQYEGLALLRAQAAKLDNKGLHKKSDVKVEVHQVSGSGSEVDKIENSEKMKNPENLISDLTSKLEVFMTKEAESRAQQAAAWESRFSALQNSIHESSAHTMSHFSYPAPQYPFFAPHHHQQQQPPLATTTPSVAVNKVAPNGQKSEKVKNSKNGEKTKFQKRNKEPCFFCGCWFHLTAACPGPDAHPKAKCYLCGNKAGHFPQAKYHHGSPQDRQVAFPSKN